MIAPEQSTRRLVPVWLRVPGHADLAEVADEHLLEEMKRRGYVVLGGADVVLPGLLVYRGMPACVWRGVERTLGERCHGVLLTLAQAHPHPLSSQQLLNAVWGAGYCREVTRMTIYYLRRCLPGLVVSTPAPGSQQVRYRLNLAGAA